MPNRRVCSSISSVRHKWWFKWLSYDRYWHQTARIMTQFIVAINFNWSVNCRNQLMIDCLVGVHFNQLMCRWTRFKFHTQANSACKPSHLNIIEMWTGNFNSADAICSHRTVSMFLMRSKWWSQSLVDGTLICFDCNPFAANNHKRRWLSVSH